MNENSLPAMENLVPHRDPMRLVDLVLEAGENHLRASSSVKETWPLCTIRGADAILAIELIAQSVAAHHHWKKGRKTEPQVGLLVGVKEARFYSQLLPLGAELTVDVKTVAVIGNYGIFNGEVRLGNAVLCEAIVQVMEPREEMLGELIGRRGAKARANG